MEANGDSAFCGVVEPSSGLPRASIPYLVEESCYAANEMAFLNLLSKLVGVEPSGLTDDTDNSNIGEHESQDEKLSVPDHQSSLLSAMLKRGITLTCASNSGMPLDIQSDSDDPVRKSLDSKEADCKDSGKQKKIQFYALDQKHLLHEAATSQPSQLMCNVMSHNPIDYHSLSHFLRKRIVFIDDTISNVNSALVVRQLLLLNYQNPSKPIFMVINSPGGSIMEGLAIYDVMQGIQSPIHTLCVGKALSMAAVLLAAGAKGQRCSLPSSTIMIHQPWGQCSGQQSDIHIYSEHISKLRDRLTAILSHHTRQSVDYIKEKMDRNHYMDAQGAQEFRIIDAVVAEIPTGMVPPASQSLQNPENGESSTATN